MTKQQPISLSRAAWIFLEQEAAARHLTLGACLSQAVEAWAAEIRGRRREHPLGEWGRNRVKGVNANGRARLPAAQEAEEEGALRETG